MSRLLVWASVVGSLLLVATFVPIRGRTIAERWKAAPSAFAFAEEGMKELAGGARGLAGEKPEPKRSSARASLQSRAAARPGARGAPAAAKEPPASQERHTAADRDALDRIVAEHAAPSR